MYPRRCPNYTLAGVPQAEKEHYREFAQYCWSACSRIQMIVLRAWCRLLMSFTLGERGRKLVLHSPEDMLESYSLTENTYGPRTRWTRSDSRSFTYRDGTPMSTKKSCVRHDAVDSTCSGTRVDTFLTCLGQVLHHIQSSKNARYTGNQVSKTPSS